jgi:hypothetical protein
MPYIYSEVTIEDMAYSGPHVWPKIAGDSAYDRFIFRRPELAYLQAIRKMNEKRKQKKAELNPMLIGIRLRRIYYEGGRQGSGTTAQRFGHEINWENPTKDVRSFLVQLRHMLTRCMPDQPLLNCALQLRFYDYDDKRNVIMTWQDRWI